MRGHYLGLRQDGGCLTETQREREREKERDRDRQTDRQAGRQAGRQRQTDRQRYRYGSFIHLGHCPPFRSLPLVKRCR